MEGLSFSQRTELQKGLRLRAKFPADAVTVYRERPDEYRVRSESGNGYYLVILMNGVWTCECPAFLESQRPCKHVWAARVGLERPRRRQDPMAEIQTYGQDWPAYDAAQQAEHPLFDPLLWSLLDELEEPPRRPGKRGRNPIPLRTQILMAVKKVHLAKSCRRARGLIQVGSSAGNSMMGRVPNYAVPSRVFNIPAIDDMFVDLIQRSALPLKALEDGGTVAIDSSGFCTTCRGAYCTEMHNPTRKHRFLKAHIVIGVKTHIILNVVITDERGGDSPQFVPLLKGVTEAGFDPGVVVADGAYTAVKNYGGAAELGMEAYLPFHSNATGSTIGVLSQGSQIYRRMLLTFQLHPEEFGAKYHARSNVEALFSAIKRKLGEALSSKNPEARISELLAKLLAYNITVLIHEMFEHGIDPGSIGLPSNPPRSRRVDKARPKPQARSEAETVPKPDLLSKAIHKLQPIARDLIPAPVIKFDSEVRGP